MICAAHPLQSTYHYAHSIHKTEHSMGKVGDDREGATFQIVTTISPTRLDGYTLTNIEIQGFSRSQQLRLRGLSYSAVDVVHGRQSWHRTTSQETRLGSHRGSSLS